MDNMDEGRNATAVGDASFSSSSAAPAAGGGANNTTRTSPPTTTEKPVVQQTGLPGDAGDKHYATYQESHPLTDADVAQQIHESAHAKPGEVGAGITDSTVHHDAGERSYASAGGVGSPLRTETFVRDFRQGVLTELSNADLLLEILQRHNESMAELGQSLVEDPSTVPAIVAALRKSTPIRSRIASGDFDRDTVTKTLITQLAYSLVHDRGFIEYLKQRLLATDEHYAVVRPPATNKMPPPASAPQEQQMLLMQKHDHD
eukprot:GSA25T00006109001.1